MDFILIGIYLLLLIFTITKIVLETNSTPKTLAYLLLVIVLPVVGMIFYYSFGINYRRQRFSSQALDLQTNLDAELRKDWLCKSVSLSQNEAQEIAHFSPLIHFLKGISEERLSRNRFDLLINGEEKFPEALDVMQGAQHFIHLEYYAWENDVRGNQIKEVLKRKAQEGVIVRVLFDDYASRKIKANIVKELQDSGVAIFPKIRVRLWQFANRVNHRDHRKIIIVDGNVGFVGGINLSDRYDNSIDTGLYWRDTHVKIMGPLVNNLQRHFMISWNFSASEPVPFDKKYFPEPPIKSPAEPPALGQVVPGGPVYPKSNIMLSYCRLFSLSQEKLYITNPYFIPGESIQNSLIQAAISGVDVRLLLPDHSDSAVVGAASRFYFNELLEAGVRIFLYKKGFVHAKTVVADGRVSVVGTANMDIRSFDLNFEIMSVIYGQDFAQKMEKMFLDDLNDCREITLKEWKKIGIFSRLIFASARLISAFL